MYENRNSVERFVVVQGSGSAWGIRAELVARFTTLGQWQGSAPLTAQWSEPQDDALESTRCLLVFRTPSGEHAIRITGTITTSDLDAQKVNPLPAPCRPKRNSELVVSAIAIDGDTTLFLVVEPAIKGS